MDRWQDKVAVVTGASAGIGKQICEHLVAFGLKVVGIARRSSLIEENAKKLQGGKGKLYAVQADISKEEDILKAFQWITQNVGPVSILINNAGIFRSNGLLDGITSDWKDIFDVNVISLCVATREAIKIMRAHNIDGHIVHINSTCGHMITGPSYLHMYSASKYSVTALTETLRQELNSIGSKIKISGISPGKVKTNTFEANNIVVSEEVAEASKNYPELDPKDVADAVCYVLGTPPHVQVHDLMLSSM